MDIGNQLNKLRERRAMLDMLTQREAALPERRKSCSDARRNSSWAHKFWSARVNGEADIKRVLGVGTATLSEHLRMYKDPFEAGEPDGVAIALDGEQSALPLILQGRG
jgi:hypothetical protein